MSKISNDIELQLIGRSVLLKTSYIGLNSGADLLAESSLRYPIVECLERRIKAINVKLEEKHPSLKNRRIDIHWVYNEKNYALELKYVKPGFKQQVQRVFDDIFRLTYTSREGYRSFLLVCGKSTDFISDFQSFRKSISFESILSGENKNSSPYDIILSFDINSPLRNVTFQRTENEYYKKFSEDYQFVEGQSELESLNTSTKLLFISKSCEGIYTHTVAIWEVLYGFI